MELFRLLGVVALSGTDEAKAGVDGVTSHAEKSSGKIGKAIGAMGKMATAAVVAGTTAAATLTKTAIDSFAEYEQLVGGSKLLYGDAYAFVEEKAKNAFQNVQMSQNDYLEQMNGFATGLKTALGGDAQAAAELADKILTAEADIVAATGNSQEAVQNAFNGIMKSNFTMLDNLQLGITPTKEGFQEVIDKVNEWNAANGEATSYQIDNLADCQAALVQYVEMQGLAGYAANEASETIQGSAATMKSAWENVLVGLADSEQNMDDLLSKLGDSVLTFKDNIMPRIEQTLTGIGTLIEKVVPPIVAEIPKLITDTLPGLISAGASIVSALAQAITSALPELLQIGIDLCLQFLNGFTQNIGSVISTATEIVTTLVDGISSALPLLIPAAVEAILALAEALVNPENITMMIESALALLQALADGLLEALPKLTESAPEIITTLVTTLVDNLPKILDTGIEVLLALIDGILDAIPDLIDAIPKIYEAIWDAFGEQDWLYIGAELLVKIGEGILNGLTDLVGIFDEVMESAKETVEAGIDKLLDIMGFDWELPKLKLPHFSIDGEFSLNPPSVPKFGIEWYAKGAVLNDPTAFGINGNKLMVGGEAGAEAIAPIDVLQGYVAEAVASQNATLVAVLEKILLSIMSMDGNMAGNMQKALGNMTFNINNREFARLVKAVN